MKKALLLFWGVTFCAISAPAKEPSKPANFSGNWVLDFGQTKNLPAGLEDLSMVISQGQEQLRVETLLKGNLQPTPNVANSGGYPAGSSRGTSGAGRGGRSGRGSGGMGPSGAGAQERGSRVPSGADGWPRMEGASPGKVAGYQLYPHSAIFKLDGGEAAAQFGDSENTAATSKTEWAKNGEVLKFSLMGKQGPSRNGGNIEMKDQWRISGDGKSLMVDRSVKSPAGSGIVHLIFSRRLVGPHGVAEPMAQ